MSKEQKSFFIIVKIDRIVLKLNTNDLTTKDQFKMYANSIRINKFRIQLLLGLIIVGFLGILWNKKINKK